PRPRPSRLLFHRHRHRRHLHSFPTRRSSDLDMLAAVTDYGVTGRAVQDGTLNVTAINPRDFTTDRHGTVDDRPFGGGPGMVMKIDRKSTRLNSSHVSISYAVFCLKKNKTYTS